VCRIRQFPIYFNLIWSNEIIFPDHWSWLWFLADRVAQSLVVCVVLCRPLFVFLYFFFWPLYCLLFFNVWLLISPFRIDCTGCQKLSNPTHQGTREMFQIVQDVRTCLIRHTKRPGKCFRLYRMSEPVSDFLWHPTKIYDPKVLLLAEIKPQYSNILYNLTHFSGPLVCRIRQVLTSCTITGCQNLSNPTHQGTREMFQIVQDVRTCLIWHTKGPGKCFRLYRMSEPV
jgi:hypothetical protein